MELPASSGARARYVRKVGDDIAAELHRRNLRASVSKPISSPRLLPSQQAFILVDDGGERTVLWNATIA